MENEEKKKGLFARLNNNQKEKKKSGCCNFEIEEIPDEETKNNKDETPKSKGGSCC
jgi:hypothetical protein